MTTRHDLYRLVDELPQHALGPAEAFLAFLRDRAAPHERQPDHSPGRLTGQGWVDAERLGIEQRRQDRDSGEKSPDSNDTA